MCAVSPIVHTLSTLTLPRIPARSPSLSFHMPYSVRSTPSDSHCRPQTRDLAISNQNQKRHRLLDRPALWQPSISPQIRPTPNPGLPSTCISFDRKARFTVGRPAVPQKMVNSTLFLPVSASCSSGCLEVLCFLYICAFYVFCPLFCPISPCVHYLYPFCFRPIPGSRPPPQRTPFVMRAAHYTPPLLSFSACIKSCRR
jgi:hypothetical protein